MKPVLVEWTDAEGEERAWVDKEEVERDMDKCPQTVITIGFLLHSSDTHITLIGSNGDSQYGDINKIPRGMVKTIKEVRVIE